MTPGAGVKDVGRAAFTGVAAAGEFAGVLATGAAMQLPGTMPSITSGRPSRVPGFVVGPELDALGKPQPAPFPSLFPYFGPDVELFSFYFGDLGTFMPLAVCRVTRRRK